MDSLDSVKRDSAAAQSAPGLGSRRQDFDVAVIGMGFGGVYAVHRFTQQGLSVLGLGLIVAIFIQVRVGLQPLRRVTQSLHRIRDGSARRLEGNVGLGNARLVESVQSTPAMHAPSPTVCRRSLKSDR